MNQEQLHNDLIFMSNCDWSTSQILMGETTLMNNYVMISS